MQAAFFDLDKTVIAKASMAALIRPFSEAGMISRWLILRAAWSHFVFQTFGADEARMVKFRESALRATRGWDHAKVSSLVAEHLHEVIEPLVYEEALDLIAWHRSEGHRIYIVSASPEEVVVPLARYLGADEAIATRARLDDEGRYSGEVEFYSYGPFKAEKLHELADTEGIDLAESYAYSDSATDLPMLEAVGHPVAVNPDRELSRAARARHWEIRQFRNPVALRDRVIVPPPVIAAVAAGALIGLGAGAATTWWWRRHRVPQSRAEQLAELVAERLAEAGSWGAAASARTALSRPAASGWRRPRGRRGRRGRSASSWPRSVGGRFVPVSRPGQQAGDKARTRPRYARLGGVRAPGGLPRLQSGWDR